MNATQTNPAKRRLLVLWCAMAAALAVYAGLTYLIPAQPKVLPPGWKLFLGILQVVAAVEFLAGMLVERVLLRRATNPAGVLMAGIISAAIGVAIALFGLVVYLSSQERHWEFFAVSALYFLRLFIHLPEFNDKIDQTSAP
jgi:hypothetical protein